MERHEKPSKLFGKEKTLEPLKFQGFSSILELDQRLLNCGARRAALRPYSPDFLPGTLVFTWFSGFVILSSLTH